MTTPDPRFPHLFTLADFIRKFAPPIENLTEEYIKNVSGRLGVDPTHPLHLLNVDDLAEAMAHQEGWYVEIVDGQKNLPQRNNNPGDLRYARQRAATGADARGYAIFATPEDGWEALRAQIRLDQARAARNWLAQKEAAGE